MAAFDYTARDFTNIKSDLLRRASRVAPDWTSRDPSDFGMLMVDLWAQMGDVMHYYIDRVAGESFLATAKQRESVLSYASLLGYNPSGAVAALGTVTVSNSSTEDAFLPPFTSFIAQDGDSLFYFYTEFGYSIPAGSLGVDVNVVEGVRISDEVLTPVTGASGDNNQTYTLAYTNVPTDSIRINVFEDGVTPTPYSYVTRLLDATSNSRVFRVKYDADEFTQVVFGGSGQGIAPSSGVRIEASYSYCSGASGNLSANKVIGFTNSPPLGVSVTASSSMTGGQNPEPISALRFRIPTALRSQDRAVTSSDYADLVRSVDGVAKSTVSYSPNFFSVGNASVTVYPHIDRTSDYVTTTDTSQPISSELIADVLAVLTPKSMMGIDIVFPTSIAWTVVYIELTAYVSPTYYSYEVLLSVENVIKELFSFNSVTFNQRITLGDFYRSILSVTGLDYAIVTKFNTDNSTSVEDEILIGAYALPKVILGSGVSDSVTINTVGGVSG